MTTTLEMLMTVPGQSRPVTSGCVRPRKPIEMPFHPCPLHANSPERFCHPDSVLLSRQQSKLQVRIGLTEKTNVQLLTTLLQETAVHVYCSSPKINFSISKRQGLCITGQSKCLKASLHALLLKLFFRSALHSAKQTS